MDSILNNIRSKVEYKELLKATRENIQISGLGLPRAARLPLVGALQKDTNRPILLLTDRADHALSLYDELAFWAPDAQRFLFSEPNPLFYEDAAWGNSTRRERLLALTALSNYHLPLIDKLASAPVIVASARSVMTKTIPRRDFLKASKRISTGQSIKPETLLHSLVALGYQVEDTVIEPGQISRRGGILDVWVPAEPLPTRLDYFGDEIETIRRFDPASQRTIEKLDFLLITPAREFLQLENSRIAQSIAGDLSPSEFHIPEIHPDAASLLEYLPPRSLVLVDDLSMVESMVSEVEEQAVKFRQECIDEGILPVDFPVPYISWSELFDSMQSQRWIELGHSTELEVASSSTLAVLFEHGQRFGGHLKSFIEYLTKLLDSQAQVIIVSRQSERLRELWEESSPANTINENPQFFEASLT
jgi:transcription-repair coupling factor (superfamily II helicase)